MSLEMDKSSYINKPSTILSDDSRKSDGKLPKIKIGKKCSIAINCTFILIHHTSDTFSTSLSKKSVFAHNKGPPSCYSKGDIVIKNDVWIGANCTILDGLTIGNGAIIGAGSVVTKDVPAYAVVGGNPAKIIKYRFKKELIDEIEKTGFWDMDISEIEKFDIHTRDIEDIIQKIKAYQQTKTLFNQTNQSSADPVTDDSSSSTSLP